MLSESEIENLVDNASDIEILLIKKFFQLGLDIGQNIADQIKKGTLPIPEDGKIPVTLVGDSYHNQNKFLAGVISYTPQILALGNSGLVIIRGQTVVNATIEKYLNLLFTFFSFLFSHLNRLGD